MRPVTVAKAEHEEDALAGLERWKARHPEVAGRLHANDVLVDSMRGRSSTWSVANTKGRRARPRSGRRRSVGRNVT
jgi:hypothetical protein